MSVEVFAAIGFLTLILLVICLLVGTIWLIIDYREIRHEVKNAQYWKLMMRFDGLSARLQHLEEEERK